MCINAIRTMIGRQMLIMTQSSIFQGHFVTCRPTMREKIMVMHSAVHNQLNASVGWRRSCSGTCGGVEGNIIIIAGGHRHEDVDDISKEWKRENPRKRHE